MDLPQGLNKISGEKKKKSGNLLNRKSHLKNGAFVLQTDSFYLSVMSINNFFANGKTYSATFVLISTMQKDSV